MTAGRNALVLENLALCRRAARRFWRPGLETEDLEQIAALGLLKAADRYEPTRKVPFAAFAWVTILGELGHWVRDHEHAMRIPRPLRKLAKEYAAAWERLAVRLERVPSDREVAAELGRPLAEVRELVRARNIALPLEPDAPGVADAVIAPAPAALEDSIPEREALVVLELYLRRSNRQAVGRRMGVSAKVVEALRKRALSRLRAAFAS